MIIDTKYDIGQKIWIAEYGSCSPKQKEIIDISLRRIQLTKLNLNIC